MNRKIKSAINKHCYRLGLNHYEELRKQMIARATVMARSGISPQEIVLELGIPMPIEQNREDDDGDNVG